LEAVLCLSCLPGRSSTLFIFLFHRFFFCFFLPCDGFGAVLFMYYICLYTGSSNEKLTCFSICSNRQTPHSPIFRLEIGLGRACLSESLSLSLSLSLCRSLSLSPYMCNMSDESHKVETCNDISNLRTMTK